MGHMRRGRVPVRRRNGMRSNNGRRYCRGVIIRRHYYVPLDNSYVLLQMIVSIIIFTIAGITFLATYKSPVIDVIADVKRNIINSHVISCLVLLGFSVLANYFSKDKFALVKRLIIIMVGAIITIFLFSGIKLNMNSTYTKNKFEEIYSQEHIEEQSKNNTKLDIGLTGVNFKSEKEYYVDKCMEAYNVFSVRLYSTFALNFLLIFLLAYQIIKVSNIQEKMDRLSKDDAILYDEEENIKL